jgi:6-phosphogluconate dehydrogenase
MKIIVSGLGRMGGQIAQKLAEGGHEVIANNRSKEPIEIAVSHGAAASYTKEDAAKAFAGEKAVLWLMLPHEVIDAQLEDWFKLLPAGSLIVDGGNSDYRDTRERAKIVRQKGHFLLDVGTSGGVWGYKNGFCMMAGGEKEAFDILEPALATLSKPNGGYAYFSGSGSGHFVKMVHNAIEYGMMQSLADGYMVLKNGPYKNVDLAAAGKVWQQSSVITSWLNELATEAIVENPNMEGIEGVVAETGEARWTLETAKELNIPMPAIQAAFDVRLRSQQGEINFATKLLAAIRNKFGGHQINPGS